MSKSAGLSLFIDLTNANSDVAYWLVDEFVASRPYWPALTYYMFVKWIQYWIKEGKFWSIYALVDGINTTYIIDYITQLVDTAPPGAAYNYLKRSLQNWYDINDLLYYLNLIRDDGERFAAFSRYIAILPMSDFLESAGNYMSEWIRNAIDEYEKMNQ